MASKIKHAYINYNQIQPLIDNGRLDEYTLIIAKDRLGLYFVDENLKVQPVSGTNSELLDSFCCCEEDILKLFKD